MTLAILQQSVPFSKFPVPIHPDPALARHELRAGRVRLAQRQHRRHGLHANSGSAQLLAVAGCGAQDPRSTARCSMRRVPGAGRVGGRLPGIQADGAIAVASARRGPSRARQRHGRTPGGRPPRALSARLSIHTRSGLPAMPASRALSHGVRGAPFRRRLHGRLPLPPLGFRRRAEAGGVLEAACRRQRGVVAGSRAQVHPSPGGPPSTRPESASWHRGPSCSSSLQRGVTAGGSHAAASSHARRFAAGFGRRSGAPGAAAGRARCRPAGDQGEGGGGRRVGRSAHSSLRCLPCDRGVSSITTSFRAGHHGRTMRVAPIPLP